MEFPEGVTGFGFILSENSLNLSRKKFRSLCYEIDRLTEYKIINLDDEIIGCNFFFAQFHTSKHSIELIINGFYPYASGRKSSSLSNDNSKEASFNFCDIPLEMQKIVEKYYRVLHKEELNKPFKIDSIQNQFAQLNKDEIRQIKSWEPKIIGEIVFNYWD